MLSGCNLTDANLQGALLANVLWRDAELAGADLRGAQLDPQALKQADFSGALVLRTIEALGMTLDEILTAHAQWAATNGKEGKQALLACVDFNGKDFVTTQV